MSVLPKVEFFYKPDHDTNDGAPWTGSAISDLASIIKNGGNVDDAAALLCRQGTVEDVRRKAKELGLVG